METELEELVSVRPLLASAPSSSCALTAALTGDREKYRHQRKLCQITSNTESFTDLQQHLGYLSISASLVSPTLERTEAPQCALHPAARAPFPSPSASRQSTEMHASLDSLVATFSFNSVLYIFIRPISTVSQIKEGLFLLIYVLSSSSESVVCNKVGSLNYAFFYNKQFTMGTKKLERPQQSQVAQCECLCGLLPFLSTSNLL